MASDYQEIIRGLGEQLSFPLQPDSQGACALLIEGELRIQIELDADQTRILIAATLADLSPQSMRRTILTRALQDNGGARRHYGIFAYSRRANQLVLEDHLSLDQLTGKGLFDFLQLFAEKAWLWYRGCQTGQLPAPTPRKSDAKPRLGRAEP